MQDDASIELPRLGNKKVVPLLKGFAPSFERVRVEGAVIGSYVDLKGKRWEPRPVWIATIRDLPLYLGMAEQSDGPQMALEGLLKRFANSPKYRVAIPNYTKKTHDEYARKRVKEMSIFAARNAGETLDAITDLGIGKRFITPLVDEIESRILAGKLSPQVRASAANAADRDITYNMMMAMTRRVIEQSMATDILRRHLFGSRESRHGN